MASTIGDNIYMDYSLTEHARNSLQKRKIPYTWVKQTVNAPEMTETDKVDPDLEHCLARIPGFENRVLRVVVNNKVQPPRIITAFFDRRVKIS